MPDIIITPSSGIIDFFPVSTRVGRIDGSSNALNILNPSGYVSLTSSGLSINSASPNATLFAYSATSGATLLNLEGTNGSLFSVIDSLSGTLMSVNNNAGLPVLEVFSDDRVVAGRFGQNDFVISSSGNIGVGVGSPSAKLDVNGVLKLRSSLNSVNMSVDDVYGLNIDGNVDINLGSFKISDPDLGDRFFVTSNGSVTSGSWNASTIAVNKGGTGATTLTTNEVLIGNGTNAVSTLSRSGIDSRSTFPPASHAITTHSAAAWRMFYSNATTTAIQELAFGNAGTYLRSAGASSIPTWSNVQYSELSGTVPTWNQNTTGSAATLTTARTLTIGSTGKTFNGGADVSWSLSEIGAAAINQTMHIGTTAVAINRTSASLFLAGVSIDGNASTVTSGVYCGSVTVNGNIPTWLAATNTLGAGYAVSSDLSTTNTSNHIPRADAVKTYVDNLLSANDAMVFKGTLGTGGTVTALPTGTVSAGWAYRVITAGTYAGVVCEIGDLIIAVADAAGSTNSTWTVVQTNIDGAVVGPASSTNNNFAIFNGTTGKLISDSGLNSAGSALTKTDDTNVTLTLGGSASTSLLRAASITAGWSGQLSVGRGGTGASTLTGVTIGNGTNAITAVAGSANQLLRRNSGNTAYEFFTHDFVSTSRSLTIAGTTNQISVSLTGAQDLTANRSWTLSLPQNIHTSASPTFAGLTSDGIINVRASASASTATQIPVFVADPSSTTRAIVTRTPAQLLGDIGAAATNQTMHIGTTAVAINRASANLALTGITSIDGTSIGVVRTVTGTNSTELVRGNMADNDNFRILVGGTATNAGYAEIATADDGTEPIYIRQYTGTFTTLTRTATILDGSGNTIFPGTLTSNSIIVGSQTNKATLNYSINTARTYTIPDAGANTDFVMAAGDQTIGGVKTFTSQIISTKGGTSADNGQIYLNGTDSNRIEFNVNGSSNPNIFSKPVGQKITLYPSRSTATADDFSFGIGGDVSGGGTATRFWQTIDRTTSRFEWYAAASNIATLTGSGVFTVAGSTSQINVDNLRLDGNTLSAINTNGELIIAPSGTGALRASATGNARGNNAVDLQTSRSSNIEVASGANSVICGGTNNAVSSSVSSIVGGAFNLIRSLKSSIAGGNGNIIAEKARRANSVGSSTSTITVFNALVSILNNTTANALLIKYVDEELGTNHTVTRTVSTATQSGNNVTLVLTAPVGPNWTNIIVVNTSMGDNGFGHVIGGGNNNLTYSQQGNIIGGGGGNTNGGSYSTIGGGFSNTVRGSSSVIAGGKYNIATGTTSSVCGGAYNQATGYYSTLVGGGHYTGGNQSAGSWSTVGGGGGGYYAYSLLNFNRPYNLSNGYGSVISGGTGNRASGDWSFIPGGIGAKSPRPGELSHAAGLFETFGDAQHSVFVGRRETSGTTPANLFIGTGPDQDELRVLSDEVLSGTINIVGTRNTGANVARYLRQFTIKNVGGTTSLVGSIIEIGTDVADGTSISITAANNAGSDYLRISVTGRSGETWRWVAVVDCVVVGLSPI